MNIDIYSTLDKSYHKLSAKFEHYSLDVFSKFKNFEKWNLIYNLEQNVNSERYECRLTLRRAHEKDFFVKKDSDSIDRAIISCLSATRSKLQRDKKINSSTQTHIYAEMKDEGGADLASQEAGPFSVDLSFKGLDSEVIANKSRDLDAKELERVTIKESTFNNADLSSAMINETDIVDSSFDNAQFDSTEIVDTTLDNISLVSANFEDSALLGVEFKDSDLQKTNFENSIARDCSFEETDLRYSNLKDSSFDNCSFEDSDLRKSNLKGADLEGSALKGARLYGAQYDEETKLPFEHEEALSKGMIFVQTPG